MTTTKSMETLSWTAHPHRECPNKFVSCVLSDLHDCLTLVWIRMVGFVWYGCQLHLISRCHLAISFARIILPTCDCVGTSHYAYITWVWWLLSFFFIPSNEPNRYHLFIIIKDLVVRMITVMLSVDLTRQILISHSLLPRISRIFRKFCLMGLVFYVEGFMSPWSYMWLFIYVLIFPLGGGRVHHDKVCPSLNCPSLNVDFSNPCSKIW